MISAETRQQRRYRQRQEKKGVAQPQKGAFKRALEMFKLRKEALEAAAVLTPLLAKLALMDLAMKLDYRSRGKGRGMPMRRHGLQGSWPRAHQSGQECLRRAVGGWGFRKRQTGLTKLETLRMLAPHSKIPLERAIAIVRGLEAYPKAA